MPKKPHVRKNDLRNVRCDLLKKKTSKVKVADLAKMVAKQYPEEDAGSFGQNIHGYRSGRVTAGIRQLVKIEHVLNLPKGSIYQEVAESEKRYVPDLEKRVGTLPVKFDAGNPLYYQSAAPLANGHPGSKEIKGPFSIFMAEHGGMSRSLASEIFASEGKQDVSKEELKTLEYQIRSARAHGTATPELAERVAKATKTPVEKLTDTGTAAKTQKAKKAKQPQKSEAPLAVSTVASSGNTKQAEASQADVLAVTPAIQLRLIGPGIDRVITLHHSGRRLEDENGQKALDKDENGRFLRILVTNEEVLNLLME